MRQCGWCWKPEAYLKVKQNKTDNPDWPYWQEMRGMGAKSTKSLTGEKKWGHGKCKLGGVQRKGAEARGVGRHMKARAGDRVSTRSALRPSQAGCRKRNLGRNKEWHGTLLHAPDEEHCFCCSLLLHFTGHGHLPALLCSWLKDWKEGWYDSFILMQGGGVTLLSFPRLCGWHCILASDKPSVKSVCTKYFNYKNNTALSKSKSKQGS